VSASLPAVSSRLPRPRRQWSKERTFFTTQAVALVGITLVVFLVLWRAGTLFGRAPYNGPTWTVKKEKLKVTIVARGNLESAKNGDIVCSVRSGTKGSTNASTIKWLIDNGTEVKKGEKVIELDDSGLQENLKAQNITVDNAKADWVKADEQYRIDEIAGTTAIEAAVNARDLARLDLKKYKEGDYPQALADVEGRIETAKSDLESWKDRAAWSARMVKKGLMSKVQADADKDRVQGSKIALDKLEKEKEVLVKFTKDRTIQDLTAKVKEAERTLEKQKIQDRATRALDEAARKSKRSIYDQEVTKKNEIVAEIAKCIVLAPQDGLVVYYVPEQVRGGGGTQQSIVAQGEPVREGQKMMQIPDLSLMQVNVRVPEALVKNLHNEEDASDKSTWQRAQIRVDAFSSELLRGHIKTIDTVASQQDWFAADVKVYKTIISIDSALDSLNLKPGMSAEVTISADESPTPVLVVPVQAVLGTISSGADRKCFVIASDGQPVLRDIVVGMSNERLVEVKSGLQEGDRVVLSPRALLTDDSELKPGRDRSKSHDDSEGGGNGGKKNGKKGGKKKMDGPGPGPGVPKGPGGPGVGGKGFAGGPPTEEQKRAWEEKMRNATPAERRQMINSIPEQFRAGALQKIREKGLEVAD
jgi:HlyD family secretion protein